MGPWDSASRWINTALLVIVGVIGFDTLFRLLDANETNVIVGFTRAVANVLLAPFQGMFDAQEYLLTALIAVLGYALLAGVALAVTRSVQSSRRREAARAAQHPGRPPAWGQPPRDDTGPPGQARAVSAPPSPGQRPGASGRAADADRTQPFSPGPSRQGPPPAGDRSPSTDRTASTGEHERPPAADGDDTGDRDPDPGEGAR